MKNGSTYKRKWLFLIGWTMLSLWVQAQSNLAFYPLNNQFNSFEYNPAFLTSREKFTFSVFPLAGLSAGFNNQEIITDMASELLSGEITRPEYEKYFTRMLNHTTFHEHIEGSLLNFTYRSKAGFFNFNIQDRQFLSTTVKGKLLDFIFNSQISSTVIGRSQKIPFQAAHYRQYSLGYSRTSRNKKLTAGVRAKLYFGKSALYGNIQGSINNLSGEYAVTTAGTVNISFPDAAFESNGSSSGAIDFSVKSLTDYIWNTGNPGLGVDLGINYELNPKLSISASVTDLGKINWKSDLNSRSLEEEFPFPAGTWTVDTIQGVPTIFRTVPVSYSGILDFSSLERDSMPFSRALPMHLYAGMKYRVNPGLSISIADRFTVIKELNYNSLSVTADFDVNQKLAVSTGYSMIGDAYFNIPLALLLKQNFGQVYFGTDNLMAFVFSSKADLASFSFGACFYLFRYRNLLLKRSELFPFYQPRKTIKNRRSGLIIKAREKYD